MYFAFIEFLFETQIFDLGFGFYSDRILKVNLLNSF